MTRTELLSRCQWDTYDVATLSVYLPIFGRDVRLECYPEDGAGRTISDKMLAAIQDLRSLDSAHEMAIAQLLYAHCEMCFDAISYGHVDVLEGEMEVAANRRTFGIYTPADAYRQAHLESVAVRGENDRYTHRYAELLFYPEWEDEHGCTLIVQNGIPIDWQESMPHMGKYETR